MYLHNLGTHSLRYLPVGIGELIRLREVREFVVGGGYDRACSLGSLKKLNLRRQCRIRGLGGVSDAGEARRAELEKKKYLFDLELDFDHIREMEMKNKLGGGRMRRIKMNGFLKPWDHLLI
ncbi:hypothetical protein CUMW_199410 [Citrus unshiu]|nr:hypothetical protein CUMW_199410 [Citrus unshiu]